MAAQTPLIDIGMAIKGPQLSKAETAVADLRAAAERGVLASMHQSAGAPGPAWKVVTDAGLWNSNVNIVHGTGLSREWVTSLVAAGVTFTSTPENELGQGHVTRLTERLLAIGAAPSLGTDTEMVAPGELLIAARVALAEQRALGHDRARRTTGLGAPKVAVTAKQALAWATIEGARALGLADRIGYLGKGMQADLTIIDARALNLWPAHNPIAAALHANSGNIEAVMIAGQWRKRDHALVDAPIDVAKAKLEESGDRLTAILRKDGGLLKLRRGVVQRVVQKSLRQQTKQGGPIGEDPDDGAFDDLPLDAEESAAHTDGAVEKGSRDAEGDGPR